MHFSKTAVLAAAAAAAATVASATPLVRRVPEPCPANPDGTRHFNLITKQEPGHSGINMDNLYPHFHHLTADRAFVVLKKEEPNGSNLQGTVNWIQFKNNNEGFWGLDTAPESSTNTSPSANFRPVFTSKEKFGIFGIGNDGTLRVQKGSGGSPTDAWVTWVACEPTDQLKDAGIQDPILLWADKDLGPLEFGTLCNKVTLEVDSCTAIA